VVPPLGRGFPTGAPDPHWSPAADQAAELLDRAALLTVARRAGRRPDQAEVPPAAAPDPRPPVGPAAGHRLARILGGENSDLLTEWLTAVAAHGLRPPPQFMPVLLDRARRVSPAHPDPDEARLRGLVATAGGPRAQWLASLNPAWGYLLAEPAGAPVPPPTAYLSAAELADVLARAMREITQSPLTAHRVIRLAGRRADPALGAPGAMAEFPPQAPNVLHNMLAVLRFRYEMLKELDDDRRGG
jgi:hypothetical protein